MLIYRKKILHVTIKVGEGGGYDKKDMQTCQNWQTFRVCYCYFLHVKLTHRNKFAYLVIYYLWGQATFLDGFACGYPNHIPIIGLKSL